MKKFLRRAGYGLATAGMIFGMGFANVLAQTADNNQANGFRISPVRSELTIEKGKSQTMTVTVENPAGVPTVAKPVINDFVASSNEDGEPRLILDDNAPLPKNDFKKLVEPFDDVQLGPNEKKDVSVKITVPADANAGGYYGAIRFVPAADSSASQNVGLTASVGTIVLVRVPGNLTEKLDLVQFAAAVTTKDEKNGGIKARSFFTSGDVNILTRLKNDGDIHLQPFGKIVIKNMFGKEVQTIEFNNSDPRANILPDSTRRFVNQLKKQHWFGRYTVEANLGYRQGSGDLITAKTAFWYIPGPILLGIIVLILAIVGGVYWFIRKQKARRQHKHEVNKRKSS